MTNIFAFLLWNLKEVMTLKSGEKKKTREIEVNGDTVDTWDLV